MTNIFATHKALVSLLNPSIHHKLLKNYNFSHKNIPDINYMLRMINLACSCIKKFCQVLNFYTEIVNIDFQFFSLNSYFIFPLSQLFLKLYSFMILLGISYWFH